MIPARLVEVLVDPLPRVDAKVSQQLVCSGTTFSISFLPKSWGTSPMLVRWVAEVLSGQATGIGAGSLSPLASVSETLINLGTSPARIRYTFFPQFQACEGVPVSVEIEVLPELTVIPQQDLVFCSGELVFLPEFATNLSGVTIAYFWEVDDPSIGIESSSGSGSQIPPFVAINTGASPKQTRITVTPKMEDLANGISCAGTPSSFLVTVRAPIQIQEQLSDYGGYGVSCAGGFDGKILLKLSGGNLPSENANYTFSWTGPENFMSTAASLVGLQAGVYRVRVATAGGNCLLEKSMELTQADSLQVTQSQVNNSCFQGTSGSLEVIASGGVPPYSYAWTGPNNFSASVANPQNLVSGTYQVSVTDANGCAVTGAPQTITEPAQLALTQRKIDNTCFQGAAGSITVTPSGGTAPYSYAWTGPNNFSSTVANPQNLVSGIYHVTITDANGCTITGALQIITEPEALLLSQSKVDNVCFQGNAGSISITASGGTAPYSYAWTGPNNFSSRVANPQNLVSGTYQVTVFDANGCTPLVGPPITLTEPPVVTINAQVQSESCADVKDGRIELTLTGGTPPYTLSWEHGDTDAIATGLGAGSYQIRVTDQAGCTQVATYELLPLLPLSLQTSLSLQATQVPVQISALLQAKVGGGTPPYTYRWNTGQTGAQIRVTQSGVYRLAVQDSRGCFLENQVVVSIPLPMSLSLNVSTVALCEEGGQETIVQLQLTDGLLPYQITWSRGTVSEGGLKLTTRESGVFQVEVKDALGLIEKRTLTIPPRLTGPIAFTYLFASQTEFEADLAGFKGLFRPLATWPFQVVSWNFGDGSSSSEASPTHTYASKGKYLVTLTVLDQAGCLFTQSKELDILDYFIEIPNVFTPNGDALNDTFFPKFRFVRNLQLQVVNKWGELIYRSQGQDDPGWDGLVSGEKAPEGVYVYMLRYQIPDGRIVTSTSTFLLAR
jgi:gliding motility-associated-like protein